jgi:hypothetical protein
MGRKPRFVALFVFGAGLALAARLGTRGASRTDADAWDPGADTVTAYPNLLVGSKPTSSIALAPGVAALTDQLAALHRFESEQVGKPPRPSRVYPVYSALVAKATRANVVSLLQHESPCVRLYMAVHVLRFFPEDSPAVYPLLSDRSRLEELEGDTIALTDVADGTMEALDRTLSPTSPHIDLLIRIANDQLLPKDVRAAALTSLSRVRRAEAQALALSLVDDPNSILAESAARVVAQSRDSAAE